MAWRIDLVRAKAYEVKTSVYSGRPRRYDWWSWETCWNHWLNRKKLKVPQNWRVEATHVDEVCALLLFSVVSW